MNDIIVNRTTVDEILSYIHTAVKELRSHHSKPEELLIFIPHYVELGLTLHTGGQSLTVFYGLTELFGVPVRRGYDQERIVITNAGRDRFLERVYNYEITYVDQQLKFNKIGPAEYYG